MAFALRPTVARQLSRHRFSDEIHADTSRRWPRAGCSRIRGRNQQMPFVNLKRRRRADELHFEMIHQRKTAESSPAIFPASATRELISAETGREKVKDGREDVIFRSSPHLNSTFRNYPFFEPWALREVSGSVSGSRQRRESLRTPPRTAHGNVTSL